MLRNYLKITFRNIRKHKGYSLINILGLATGIAVCVLIFQYVTHELSYDKYHSKSDQIYRITMDHPRTHIALTPSMFSPTFQRVFPGIQSGVRLYNASSFQPLVVRHRNKAFEERKIVYADSTLFQVFDFELLAGNPNTALSKPNTVVLTRKMAEKYFDDKSPVGESIEIDGQEYEITGVMENIPDNSHFKFDFFGSLVTYNNWGQLSDETWKAANFYTYMVLEKGSDINGMQRKINEYVNENFPDNKFAASLEVVFEPLTDIHLYSETDGGIAPQSDIRYILGASAIAFLILVIACINYMNLATARSARRSREVGIRKVLGSQRHRLISQFYGETAFLVILAVLLSVFLVEFFLPWFNQLAGRSIAIDYASLTFWALISGTGILVTLLAGSYPALMLSSFKPAAALKGSKVSGGNSEIRKFLVVFQFSASAFLIIGTLVIYQQINFMQEKELGYKQDNVLVLTANEDVEKHFDAFRSELKQFPEFQEAALTSETPTNIEAGYGPDVEGVDEGPNFLVNALRATPEFTDALNIQVMAGRSLTRGDFTRANQSGDYEIPMLVNEATAAHFGMKPEELVGRNASIGGGGGTIVGVVEDFHFTSLHQPIEPLFIFPRRGFNKLLLSFNTVDIHKTLTETRALWNNMFPQYPFEYEFLDQEYNALYLQETRAGNIFTGFSVLAIFVACLGLVGLASYMVEQRTREIGIRKVMGATVTQVMAMFSKDFIVLILIGYLVSVPLAWYGMSQWLQNFAYRIEIQWSVFILAGFITLFMALITVSYQALKAARLDPVKSLQSE